MQTLTMGPRRMRERGWCGDTLTPLQYDAGRVKRGREGFGEVRSIVVEGMAD